MDKTVMESLRDSKDGEELWIQKGECEYLVTILACVITCLESGKLWFNSPEDPINKESIEFLRKITKRFANIKIEDEQ